jgi:exodeoxyribonuclease-3
MWSPNGMHAFYHCAEKKGYSGVGIWSKAKPDRVIEGFDGGEFDEVLPKIHFSHS